jgi:hypothetical protein
MQCAPNLVETVLMEAMAHPNAQTQCKRLARDHYVKACQEKKVSLRQWNVVDGL